MFTLFRFVLAITGVCCVALSADIQLPQGNRIGIDTLQRLQAAHGAAQNQKVKEDLFLSLPLVIPNQTSSITVTNRSPTVETSRNAQHIENSSLIALREDDNKFHSAGECNNADDVIWAEGWDPCYLHAEDDNFVACLEPCQFTREVSRKSPHTLLHPTHFALVVS